MPAPIRIGVCVPTVRDDAIRAFIAAWSPYWAHASGIEVRLFVHEDRPASIGSLSAPEPLQLTRTTHQDIDAVLGEAGWIIPRGAGACRSFPMLLAWRAGCDYIVTLDDDCYPDEDGGTFLQSHVAAFTCDRWFRTISGDEPRGIPYQRRGSLPVRVNHGLWTGVPDLDGPTSLVRLRDPKPVSLPPGHGVVPPGMAFPLCAMNVCYHRDIMPASYNLLMGLETFGFDRFDDIWSGLLIKRVLDYMGWYAVSGEPRVRHVKGSNAFANLRKEALALEIHERLWDFILDAPIEPGLNVTGAFAALAERIRIFPEHADGVPNPPGYFPRLADAMRVWCGLFAEGA